MPALTITSFGYRHGAPPFATVTVDLREILRDPHVSTHLRYLTAHDAEVREAVFHTPGAIELQTDLLGIATTLIALHERTGRTASIAIGCAGGRHRAATMAMSLAELLLGEDVELMHRDLHRDVIER